MPASPIPSPQVLIAASGITREDAICRFFIRKGAMISTCCHLQDLSSLLPDANCDLLLLNVASPDDDGLELIAKIVHDYPGLPLVVIIEADDQKRIYKALQQGAIEYITKPLNLELAWLKTQRLLQNLALQRKTEEQSQALIAIAYEKQREEEMALKLYRNFFDKARQSSDILEIVIQTHTAFSGDLVLNGFSPAGKFYVLSLDAAGFGLPAALTILPLAGAFNAMVAKGVSMMEMVYTLNSKMRDVGLNDRFVACILVEVDRVQQQLHVWNGSMPEALVVLPDSGILHRFASSHMALGVLDDEHFDAIPESLPLPANGALIIPSDGLLSQINEQGEPFGRERFEQFLLDLESTQAASLQPISKVLSAFSGKTTVDDDVTVCRLNFKNLLQQEAQENSGILTDTLTGDVRWQLTIKGKALVRLDALSQFNLFLKNAGFDQYLCQRAFTVIAELYNNALDHGVLALNSALKTQPDGFLEYLEQRDLRAQQLSPEDSVQIDLLWQAEPGELSLVVTDSGSGYEYDPEQQDDLDVPSGRGLAVIKSLCRSYSCPSPGNVTSVTLK
jgi:serine phosphatase RsbU (regulator of sigma subunit)